VTENSLNSQPCQEELAIALDRALRTRGGDFPLIGIFPAPIDRALIPSAIATRLYVNLRQSDWADLVAAGAQKRKPGAATNAVTPLVAKFHEMGGQPVLEIRPRSGRWYPCIVGVPKNGPLKIRNVMPGPSGGPPPSAGQVSMGDAPSESPAWSFETVLEAIDASKSLYVWFEGPLRGEIICGSGQEGEKQHVLKLEAIPR
jgi:hypothetical protein